MNRPKQAKHEHQPALAASHQRRIATTDHTASANPNRQTAWRKALYRSPSAGASERGHEP
jgi:hypothetical protein